MIFDGDYGLLDIDGGIFGYDSLGNFLIDSFKFELGWKDWFYGGVLNDFICSFGGSDFIIVGLGDDWIEGGSGFDLF